MEFAIVANGLANYNKGYIYITDKVIRTIRGCYKMNNSVRYDVVL